MLYFYPENHAYTRMNPFLNYYGLSKRESLTDTLFLDISLNPGENRVNEKRKIQIAGREDHEYH
jgi:hypothetical protein